jgi:hypothetical protein
MLVASAVLSGSALADSWTAERRFVGIADGDTITVLD